MPSVSNATFGPLVAYLVPGATVLLGLSPFSATLRGWFATPPAGAPTIGGFLYLTVASMAAGMAVSAVRWVVVDSLHRLTGLRPPALDFGALGRNVEAFALLIEIHYRHYQFYSNMSIATAVAYVGYRVRLGGVLPLGWADAGFLAIEAVFLATSRDTLKKYYDRSASCSPPGDAVGGDKGTGDGPVGQAVRSISRSSRSTNSGRPAPRAARMPRSWIRSRRLSPSSTLLTNDWLWPSRAASSTWVTPARSRVSRKSRRRTAYSRVWIDLSIRPLASWVAGRTIKSEVEYSNSE